MENPSWLSKLIQQTNLSTETPILQPIIEICGQNRLLVENHLGVIDFCCDRICVRVQKGRVIVSGKNLSLCHMSATELLIRGEIANIALCREAE